MALALTIIISLVLVVLGLIGYVRDLRRSMLALLGTLGGAILVNFWGDQWGAGLASRFVNADVQRISFYVSCAVFLWSALLVGYGGGILINRAKERPFPQRITGALLGLVNGVLIVGFLLRFATSKQPALAAMVQGNPLAKLIHDGLPMLFLGVAGLITMLVIVRGVLGLFGRGAPAPQQPAGTKPSASGTPTPSAGGQPDKRLSEQDILKKVTDAAKR
jgi:uncharacterized membrane protein required for colicin V production